MSKPGRQQKRKKKTSGLYLSIMVIHRIEDAMDLASSITVHGDQLAAGLAERYACRLLPGETEPDYVLPFELAIRDVRAALDLLADLDDRVAFARTDQLCRQMDRCRLVREELYPRAVLVRGEIDLAFGRRKGSYLHGMQGRTRRGATALQAQLRQTVRRLNDPERQLPQPKNRHAVVDRERWIRQLQPSYLDLVALSRKIDLGSHATAALTAEKNAAMEAFDLSYHDALRLAKAAFAAAGLGAKRIKNLRPYYQRRRLSELARKKRQARAAAAVVPAKAPASPKETDRVVVPIQIAKWLEDNRRLVAT